MTSEIGKIEIGELPVDIPTQTDMAGIPPRGRVGIGAGFSGNGGEIPPAFRNVFSQGEFPHSRADQTDADIFWAIYAQCRREIEDPTCVPWLSREVDPLIEKYELASDPTHEVSERKLRQFLKRADDAGLIKHRRKPTLRQYIGLLVYR